MRHLAWLACALALIACRDAPKPPAPTPPALPYTWTQPPTADQPGYTISGHTRDGTPTGDWRAWTILPGPAELQPIVLITSHEHHHPLIRHLDAELSKRVRDCAHTLEPWPETLHGLSISLTLETTNPRASASNLERSHPAPEFERCVLDPTLASLTTLPPDNAHHEPLPPHLPITFGLSNRRFVLAVEGRFDDTGRRTGPWRFFSPSGQILASGAYTDGTPRGLWITTRNTPGDTTLKPSEPSTLEPLPGWPDPLKQHHLAAP